MHKLLSITVAVLFFGAFNLLHAQDPARGGPTATWKVLKYDLDVTLPAASSRSMAAKAVLSLKNVSGSPASTLTLRISPEAVVSSVKINGATVEHSRSEETGGGARLQRAAVRFPSVAPNIDLTAIVDYRIDLKENSVLSSITPASSTFLPLSFWYPTPNSWFFTRGADMAPLRIKVISPGGLSVVSSGTETGGTFDQALAVQPFFIAGKWEVSNEKGVAVYMPAGTGPEAQRRAGELAALLSEARSFVANVLGKAPEVPLRIVAARRGGGFSSAGTLIVDESVFRRSHIDSLTAMNIAEAAAKLWLGSAVTVNDVGFGAISEGLSRYLATQFIESKYGKDVADVERQRQRNAYAAVSKRDAPMATVSPLDDYYFPVVANKGAMAWRLLAGRAGQAEFGNVIRSSAQDGSLSLDELRSAFSAHKELVNYLFDQVTDMNLRIGLPVAAGAGHRSELANSGTIDATVDVAATTATGEKIKTSATIKAQSFGQAVFPTQTKIIRAEVDTENLYPQTDYSDDVQPRESTESDPVLAAKRLFDKQDFAGAESVSRTLLRDNPRLDDLRIILARSLLAQNKTAEAEKEFRAVLNEKLPTARSLAWANVGLAEVASRANQKQEALKLVDAAIAADAEYGASLAARNLRNRLGTPPPTDSEVISFFTEFDKAASSNRKADIDALVMPGEITRFTGGVSGSTESWKTQVKQIDRVDADTLLVEAEMNIKLLNKEAETGLAVYRLTKVGNSWRLSAVEMFEVR